MLYRCLFVVFGIAERQLPKSCEENDLMNKRTFRRLISAFAALVIGLSVLTGCGTKTAKNVEKQEDAQTIQVYLWTNNLYETYAPYIQSQLPDVNIEFIVGNNDLDFYKFLQENGGLPDIITCCRFSLHDAAPLKDSLMNLALTNEAGAVYNTYLNSFKNEDGSVNWLPVCADAHGFVVNRSLFEQYGIPLPTDYESFVSACQAFEKVGIRGFTADYTYDYTCMETLQGLSAAELTTTEGRKWRTAYSDPASTARVGLDDTVWPGAFERMAQFIQDTHLTADDLALNYDDVTGMFRNGEVAMYFGSSAGVKMFQDEGIDTIFMPFFGQNGEKWIMTTPYFQIALNRDLEQDTARREKAMKVLNVMLSEEVQSRIVADGQDLLSYSQNVPLRLTECMKDVRDVVEENHMYIRIASNDFFAVSKDVVSKMIAGEYTAQQAYRAFNAQLLAEETPAETQEEETEEAGVYAEAVRYEGPTAETAAPEAEELAQPAEETAQPEAEPAPQPAPVYNYNFAAPAAPQSGAGNTADYDFYNSRSFDPFIASLNGDEREQFTEIFILKYKGATSNLPDYQVGGDNTEFFRKVFIYLGQYRDRIPDSLLAKMYQFAIRK